MKLNEKSNHDKQKQNCMFVGIIKMCQSFLSPVLLPSLLSKNSFQVALDDDNKNDNFISKLHFYDMFFFSRIMSSTYTKQKTLFFMDQSSKKRSNGRSHAKCGNLTNCSTSENNILSSPNYLGNALKIGHIQKPRSFSPFCSSNIKRRLVFRMFFCYFLIFFLSIVYVLQHFGKVVACQVSIK